MLLLATVCLCALGSLPSLSTAHPCDNVGPGEVRSVCNPVTDGETFFVCSPSGVLGEVSCWPGSVFDNNLQVCNWPEATPPCVANDTPVQSTTTTTTTTTTTSTPAPPTTTSSAASTTASPTTTTATTSTPAPPTTTSSAASTTAPPTTTTTTTTAVPPTTSGSLPPVPTAHPCDSVKAGKVRSVCNPLTNGETFFVCNLLGTHQENPCPPGLVFHNALQVCNWPALTPPCVAQDTPVKTTTTTATTASPAPPTTSSSSNSTTTTVVPTTTATQAGVTTTAPFPSGTCTTATCQAPNCRCISTSIPGDLPASQVPQMVLLTFDDAITHSMFTQYYDVLFPGDRGAALKNPNQCRTAATFFVSGELTDFNKQLVQTLAQRGSEMASHSQTHTGPSQWTPQQWKTEMQGQRQRLADVLGVTLDKVSGMRTPFLVLGGETQYAMAQNNGFAYDSSIFGGMLVDDGSQPVWPYTLKYPPKPSQTECDTINCPTRSYPELWEVPLVRQYLNDTTIGNSVCSMTDACVRSRDATAHDVLQFLRHNFNRHYETNRAPFMISLHARWFQDVKASFAGLQAFLEELAAKPDVWQITVSQMLDWMRNPLPLERVNEIPSWGCSA